MGLIDMASSSSTWRGLDYYNENRVIDYKKLNDYQYEGRVKGRNNSHYNVSMDIEHPRKSKCDCPHAKDRRVICKHIIAMYFTIFPKEADKFLKDAEEAEKEYAKYEEELYNKTIKYINSMSKVELKKALIETLNIAPEWVYERFTRDRVLMQEYLKRYINIIIVFYNKNSPIFQICIRLFLLVRF